MIRQKIIIILLLTSTSLLSSCSNGEGDNISNETTEQEISINNNLEERDTDTDMDAELESNEESEMLENSGTTTNSSLTDSPSEARLAALAKAKAKLAEKEKTNSPSSKNTQSSGVYSDVYIYSYPYKCSDADQDEISYFYPEGNMQYTMFTDLENIQYHMLYRDNLAYDWSILSNGNLFYAMISNDERGAFSSVEFAGEFSQEEIEFGGDIIAGLGEIGEQFDTPEMRLLYGKNNCEKWDVDMSVFEIPDGINFIDDRN